MYIIQCEDLSLYTGITNNLDRRLREHRSGKGGHYAKSLGAIDIVYREAYLTKQEALKRGA
ncbi:MAG: GIY-YIG nuclease family protein [Candidatus Omnitrophota bacterium]